MAVQTLHAGGHADKCPSAAFVTNPEPEGTCSHGAAGCGSRTACEVIVGVIVVLDADRPRAVSSAAGAAAEQSARVRAAHERGRHLIDAAGSAAASPVAVAGIATGTCVTHRQGRVSGQSLGRLNDQAEAQRSAGSIAIKIYVHCCLRMAAQQKKS
jgi:hypothetical protein